MTTTMMMMSGTHLDVFSTTLVFPIMFLSTETKTAAAARPGGQEGEQQQPRRDCHGVAVIFIIQ
jgi:hypothetical protein